MHAVTRMSPPSGAGGHKSTANKGGSRSREARNREAELYVEYEWIVHDAIMACDTTYNEDITVLC